MWLHAALVLVLVCWVANVASITLYGRCPHLLPSSFESSRIEPFEGSEGQILYFSNVRFDVLFDGRAEIEERYRSDYVIALEEEQQQQDPQCFRPFRLERKTSFAEPMSSRSSRTGPLSLINVLVLALEESNYLLAFSCVQLGHTKLEYVWIFGRAGRFGGIGLGKVRQMFGPWLANISTPYTELRRTHHELPFCRSFLWMAVLGGSVALLLLLLATVAIVCWRKHKAQMVKLRRSSCADSPVETPEEPMELHVPQDARMREITSAKTIAVMNGAII